MNSYSGLLQRMITRGQVKLVIGAVTLAALLLLLPGTPARADDTCIANGFRFIDYQGVTIAIPVSNGVPCPDITYAVTPFGVQPIKPFVIAPFVTVPFVISPFAPTPFSTLFWGF